MTEFAVASAALALLLLGGLALAGYQEVDRRMVVAARQTAWQATWKSGGGDLRARSRDLHGSYLADAGVFDPTGRSLLVAEENLSLESGRAAPTGLAGAAAEVLLTPLRTVSGFLGSGFDLTESGMSSGSLRARVDPLEGLPAPFDSLTLALSAPYALLGDAWHAGGPAHVAARAGGLVPATRLAALNSIWRPLAVPLSLVEPNLDELCFGIIEADRVPEDRLGPGRSPLLKGCP
jgi:hypothetical protein